MQVSIFTFFEYTVTFLFSQPSFLHPSYNSTSTTSFKVSPPTSNPESLHWIIIDVSLADGWHQTTEGIARRKSEQEEENKGDFFKLKCEV
jgi:hypothetical protein